MIILMPTTVNTQNSFVFDTDKSFCVGVKSYEIFRI